MKIKHNIKNYANIKLKHENTNFVRSVQEYGLFPLALSDSTYQFTKRQSVSFSPTINMHSVFSVWLALHVFFFSILCVDMPHNKIVL